MPAGGTERQDGECYILSNRYYEVTEVLKMARSIIGGGKNTDASALDCESVGSLDLPDRQAEEETAAVYQILFIRIDQQWKV